MITLTDCFHLVFRYKGTSNIWLQFAGDSIHLWSISTICFFSKSYAFNKPTELHNIIRESYRCQYCSITNLRYMFCFSSAKHNGFSKLDNTTMYMFVVLCHSISLSLSLPLSLSLSLSSPFFPLSFPLSRSYFLSLMPTVNRPFSFLADILFWLFYYFKYKFFILSGLFLLKIKYCWIAIREILRKQWKMWFF